MHKSGIFNSPKTWERGAYAPSSLSSPFTFFAKALKTILALFKVGVVVAIWMSFRTMGLNGIRVGSEKVLSACYWFHVARVNAYFVAAKVVNIQTLRNLALCQFIGQAMDKNLAFLSTAVSNGHHAISGIQKSTSPNKTRAQIGAGFGDRAGSSPSPQSHIKWSGFNPLEPVPKMSRGRFNHNFSFHNNLEHSISLKGG